MNLKLFQNANRKMKMQSLFKSLLLLPTLSAALEVAKLTPENRPSQKTETRDNEPVNYGTLSCRSFLDYEAHHNYQQMTDLVTCLNDTANDKSYLYSIGTSNEGRQLWVLAISEKAADKQIPGRPEVKYVANMHGNEVIGRELLLRLAYEMLFENLNDNLMRKSRIHLLFSMNPDGYELATNDPKDYLLGRENINNVDLNRDFPDLDKIICAEEFMEEDEAMAQSRYKRDLMDYEGEYYDDFVKRTDQLFNRNIDFTDYSSDPYTYAASYKEDYPDILRPNAVENFSKNIFYQYKEPTFFKQKILPQLQFQIQDKPMQPETLAIINWLNNNNFILSANLHGGDLVANYPFDSSCNRNPMTGEYATTYNASPDDKLFRMLAHSYADAHFNMSQSAQGSACDKRDLVAFENGTTNGAHWYSVPGGMQDFNYLNDNCFEITLELGCDKFPDGENLPFYWEANQPALIRYLENMFCSVSGNVSFIFDTNTLIHIPKASVLVAEPREDDSSKPGNLAGVTINADDNGFYWRILAPGTYFVKARMDQQDLDDSIDYDNKAIESDWYKVEIPENCHAGGSSAVQIDLVIETEFPMSRLMDIISSKTDRL